MKSIHQNSWVTLDEHLLIPSTNDELTKWEEEIIKTGARSSTLLTNQGNYPTITIGRPETWALEEFVQPEKLALPIRSKLNKSDFYIVRIVCSFKSRHVGVKIDQATISINFYPKASGNKAILFDMYPTTIYSKSKKDTKIRLNPTLKFSEVEASLGELSYEFCYDNIYPKIINYGVGESRAEWDFFYDKNFPESLPIEGSKMMLMLIETEKGSKHHYGDMEIHAILNSQGAKLNSKPSSKTKPIILIP